MLQRLARTLVTAVIGIIAFVIQSPDTAWAQPSWLSGVPISGPTLVEDVSILKQALETLHPRLYRYASKPKVDLLFASLATELGKGHTVAETFVLLSRFTAELKCGHTYPNYWNQSRALRSELMEGADKLSFTYRIVDGRMMVERSIAERNDSSGLRRADEIVSISGAPASRVLSTLTQLVRADGDNDAKRRSLVELRGLKDYEAADVFIPLLFPPARDLDGSAFYELTVMRGVHTRMVRSRAAKAAERNATALPTVVPLPRSAPWSWAVEGSVGILRVDKFIGKSSKGEYPWATFLEASFADAHGRRLNGVVVDIRENEGGIDEDAALLLRYLSPRGVRPLRAEQRTAYEVVPPNLRRYLDTWDTSFFNREGRVAPAGDGTFIRTEGFPIGERLEPAANAFGGRVVLLVGPVASSASHWMTQVAHESGIARVVGEPTGGSLRGGTGGELFFLRLPNSGIEIDVPLIATVIVGSHASTGVIPDIRVAPTKDDFIAGRDPARARAIVEAAKRIKW